MELLREPFLVGTNMRRIRDRFNWQNRREVSAILSFGVYDMISTQTCPSLLCILSCHEDVEEMEQSSFLRGC